MLVMILLGLQSASPSTMTPDEFRQRLVLRHMCITNEVMADTGYRELGMLYVDRGSNLPNIALTRSIATDPPHFEHGVATSVVAETNSDGSLVTARLAGERLGQPAEMTIAIEQKIGDGTGIALTLTQEGLPTRQFRCWPDRPRELTP